MHDSVLNPLTESFRKAVGDKFNDRMTDMVKNQLELIKEGKNILDP